MLDKYFAHGVNVFLGADGGVFIQKLKNSNRGGLTHYIEIDEMTDITIRELLQAGVHFGHQTRYWSPVMAPYIFGKRNKIHIINLDKTLPMMKEAMNYLGSVTAQEGAILFVGTKRQAGRIVREEAERCNSPFVDHRWLGGMLTNYKTVKNSIARLKELEELILSGGTAKLSKKEALSFERERMKLDKTLSGIKDMDGLPDVLFVIDVEHEYIAVAEANKLGIPVVAVVDSNCSIKGIDYVIPGNDDSSKAIRLFMKTAADTILEAKSARQTVADPSVGDEYIELDAQGEIIPVAVSTTEIVETKVVQTEETTEPVKTDEQVEIVESADSDDKKKVGEKKAKKKIVLKKAITDNEKEVGVAKKKVTKKKVVKKKTVS